MLNRESFEAELGNLAELAARDSLAARRLIVALGKACAEDDALSALFVDRGLDVLPAVARDDAAAAVLVSALIKAGTGSAERLTLFMDKGLEVLPALASRDGWATCSLCGALLACSTGDAQRSAVVDATLAVLPVVAFEDTWAFFQIVDELLGGRDRIARDLYNGLALTPANVAPDGMLCREFLLSAPEGEDRRRTLVIFGKDAESSIAATGCFKGNLLHFVNEVEWSYQSRSPHRPHYDEVLETAFDALARRDRLPGFREAVMGQAAG
jgi:hypothetical protein